MAASRSVAITYVPADCGSLIPGKSKAPKAFQDANTAQKLRDAGIPSVSEHHALDAPAQYAATPFTRGSVRNEALNISVCERVHRTISQNLQSPTGPHQQPPPFQLILGGECSMAPAIQAAFWQRAESHTPPQRVGLLYIDADTDLASPADPAFPGNMAGASMTHLIRGPGALASMAPFTRAGGAGAGAVCDASNTVLFGTNMGFSGNTREHFAFLFDQGYKVVSSAGVARDPERSAREALGFLEERADVIVVHFDVDAVDPSMFPLPNLPNFTGVGFEEMMRALRVVLGSKKVGGLTVAEVNPDHDPTLEMTTKLTDEIVRMLAARRVEGK